MKKTLLCTLIVAAMANSALAADDPAYEIVFGSGPELKGYYPLANDVVKACGSTVSIQNLATNGGADNLIRMAKGDVDVALVQLSTLEDSAKERPAYREYRAIASINANLLHGLTRKGGYTFTGPSKTVDGGWFKKDKVVAGESRHFEPTNMTDLKGQTVAAVGTAAQVLNEINNANKLDMIIRDRDPDGNALDDAKAMQAVREGKVVAMFTVSGWPFGMLKKASPENAGLTTINFNLAPTSTKQQIVTVDYDSIGVVGAKFIGVPNLLIAQGYEKGTPGYNNVVKFQNCLMSNWKNLRNTRGAHPGWKEATDPSNTYGWPKFEVSSSSVSSTKKK